MPHVRPIIYLPLEIIKMTIKLTTIYEFNFY